MNTCSHSFAFTTDAGPFFMSHFFYYGLAIHLIDQFVF